MHLRLDDNSEADDALEELYCLLQRCEHLRQTADRWASSARQIRQLQAFFKCGNWFSEAIYLFSGLLRCDKCGGGYTIIGKDVYGCADRVNRGTCGNKQRVKRQDLEVRVFSGLKQRLLAPELLKEFIAEFQAELNRNTREAGAMCAAHVRQLADVERRIQSILRAIEDGVYTATTKERLLELERRRDELSAQTTPSEPPVLRIHPNMPEIYRQKVAKLEEALNEPECRAEAATALRGLIDRIVINPAKSRDSFTDELHGELGAILALGDKKTSPPGKGSTGVQVSLVAGRGFDLYRTRRKL